LSTWDSYGHTPNKIANGDTADVTNDMFHRYPEDIQIMKQYGIHHYRFSIQWNRILPTGELKDGINEEGVKYYDDLINTLLENGVEPHVTIYHGETPLPLATYPHISMPFLDSENFPTWFADYAEVLFQRFGDRVKQWFTFNEPFCIAAYGGVNSVDQYLMAHNILIAHGETVSRYRSKYQKKQIGGTIGIVLNTAHFYPADPTSETDKAAAERGYDFWYGWFMDPLTKGEYPKSMRDTAGKALPIFTEEQKKLIMGSLDFVAINYYFPYVTTAGTVSPSAPPTFDKDMNITSYFAKEWPLSETGWGIYATGLRDLLIYSSTKYPKVPLMITENGLAWNETTRDQAINDVMRQQYLHDHVNAVGEAISVGCDVRGYFIWSFQDNLEWGSGFQMKFGIIWIDRMNNLERVIKNSLRWYSQVLDYFYKSTI